MATINLAPGTQYLAGIRRRRRFLFTLSAGIIVVLVLGWGTLEVAARSAEEKLVTHQGELRTLERQIVEAGPDVERVTLFEERLAAVNILLNGHRSYTPLLKELERLLPPATVLTNLTIDSEKATTEVSGTTPNIDDVAQALASLTSSPEHPTVFSTVELQSILRNEIKSGEGAPTTIEYVFKAVLTFDGKVLSTGAR